MTDEGLFDRANAVPLLGWMALAVVLAVGYAAMMAAALAQGGGSLPDLSTPTGLARAFSDPHVIPIG